MNLLPKDIFHHLLDVFIDNEIYNAIYTCKTWHDHCVESKVFKRKKRDVEITNSTVDFIIDMSRATMGGIVCTMSLIKTTSIKDIISYKLNTHYSVVSKTEKGSDWKITSLHGSKKYVMSCADRATLRSEIRNMLEVSDDMSVSYEYFVMETHQKDLVPLSYWENVEETPLGKYISHSDGVEYILVTIPGSAVIQSNSYLLRTSFSVLRSAFADNEEFVVDSKRHFKTGESAFFRDKRVHTWGMQANRG
jgi:hypothetical protein